MSGIDQSTQVFVGDDGASGPPVAARDDAGAGDRDEDHGLGFARLEPDRGARWNVETLSIGSPAVEVERSIRFDEVVVAADLDRPIAKIGDLDLGCLTAFVDDDVAVA